jgi:hypothetical protein
MADAWLGHRPTSHLAQASLRTPNNTFAPNHMPRAPGAAQRSGGALGTLTPVAVRTMPVVTPHRTGALQALQVLPLLQWPRQARLFAKASPGRSLHAERARFKGAWERASRVCAHSALTRRWCCWCPADCRLPASVARPLPTYYTLPSFKFQPLCLYDTRKQTQDFLLRLCGPRAPLQHHLWPLEAQVAP